MHCSWAGVSRVLAENSSCTDCPAEIALTPATLLGRRRSTPKGDWFWKYSNSAVWANKANPGWQQKISLEAKREHWPDSTGDSALPSPLQATPMPLYAGVPTSLSKVLANSYMTFREKTFLFSFSPAEACQSPLSACTLLAVHIGCSYSPASHSKLKGKKGKEETLCCFLSAPWCMDVEPMRDSLVLDNSLSGTYFTLSQGAVVQLQFPKIKAQLACLSLAKFLVPLHRCRMKKQSKSFKIISCNRAAESFGVHGAVLGSCPY